MYDNDQLNDAYNTKFFLNPITIYIKINLMDMDVNDKMI